MARARPQLPSNAEIALARWQGSIDEKLDGISRRVQEDHMSNIEAAATLRAKVEGVEKQLTAHTQEDTLHFAEVSRNLTSITTRIAVISGIVGLVSGAFASALFQTLLKRAIGVGD